MKPKYFVYEHRLTDGTVFYVGRGTCFSDYRYDARAYSTANRNIFWHKVTQTNKYSVFIVFRSDSISEAKDEEVRLIAKYGRRDLGLGCLVNLSDGGNDAGIGQSESTREKKKRFGEKNHFYGKKHSESSISTGRRNQPGVKPLINGDGMLFESSTLAAKYYNVDRKAIRRCINGLITSGRLKGVVLKYDKR